ncbi:hypothetical protein AAGS61_10635 [Lysinibacillus sp. KU-BSD001]|uniref:hypothetical protein n=1 Tax=Lysinibacillus sp. KU-BSD001 TaxID=3141328 RepID=UPI0036EC9F57
MCLRDFKLHIIFDIDIFSLELYRKLAIDYNMHNLYKIVPIPVLKRIFGDFTYLDDKYKYGMKGHLALTSKDEDFFEKCQALEKEILVGMQKLGYYNEIDFEINIISWREWDPIKSLTNACSYIAADTTYNLYHPKFIQLYDLDNQFKLFKYSDSIYYEDDPQDAKKIVELINKGELKINYVNSDLLPILKTEPAAQTDLCCQIEKNDTKISIYNNAEKNVLEQILNSF